MFRTSAFILVLLTGGLAQDAPVIDTVNGPVKGAVRLTQNGGTYMSFEGIPFAAPPTGKLRLGAPQPAESWTDPLDLSGHSEVKCLQYGYISDGDTPGVTGSEDCLYLNVWAPTQQTDGPKAVMMWIFGGSLTAGSNRYIEYGPIRWMDEDVIIVSPNYRLGPFGFTSLGIDEAPGNQGFLDLVAALQWIQDNIEAFGGDPNRVTIFGESSGSWAVSYLHLSPLAKGLYHRAIMQSGGLFNPYWTWQTKKDAVRLSEGMTTALNCSHSVIEDPYRALECLQEMNIDLLESTMNWGMDETYQIQKIFRPTGVIDGSFLPDNPVKMMENGDYNHVDLMVGITKDEGLLQTYQLELHPELYLALAFSWDKTFGPMFLFGRPGSVFTTEEDLDAVKKLTRHYLASNFDFNKQHFQNITDMMSDAYIWYGAYKQSGWAAANGDNVYRYMFSFKGTYGFANAFGLDNTKYGVCHADELYYFWKPYWNKFSIKFPDNEEIVSRRLLESWGNFAKFGDPSLRSEDIAWEPVTESSGRYMVIDEEWRMDLSPEYVSRMNAWDESYNYPVGDTIPPIPPFKVEEFTHQDHSRFTKHNF